MSEITPKRRLTVGRRYDITQEDGLELRGIFQGRTNDNRLIFKIEDMETLEISPGDITNLIPIYSKRIQPKIKMGKPRNIFLPTMEVQDSRTGRVFKVCEEEAQMLCRTFGFINLTTPPFTEGTIENG